MEPITRLNMAQAMKHLGLTSKVSFKKYAAVLGFDEYTGLRGVEYSKEDITKKWNQKAVVTTKNLLRA